MSNSTHSRRRFLSYATGGLGSLSLGKAAFSWLPQELAGKAKRCVLLWMNGGPSQFETFDPKPSTVTGGPTQEIQTSVAGVHIAENLPGVAKHMDKLCVLRNVTSEEGEHERAQYYLHTGYRMVPAFPRPALGSVISHEVPENGFPKYVLLGNDSYGPAYCGPDHASFAISDTEAAQELLGKIRRRTADLELARVLNSEFDHRNSFPDVARRRSMMSRIERLVATPFREVLSIDDESVETQQRYGDHEFGRRCLTARRLLERNVPFVEVQLDGWDTHINNFKAVGKLTATLDSAWSALIDDLMTTGLWSDTLVVWMGDFGRTPTINGQNGRDHFPAVTPVVLGGGCIATGRVLGATNSGGTAIAGKPYSVADVSATILQLLGIAPDTEFTTSFGSPTTATENATAIRNVIVGS